MDQQEAIIEEKTNTYNFNILEEPVVDEYSFDNNPIVKDKNIKFVNNLVEKNKQKITKEIDKTDHKKLQLINNWRNKHIGSLYSQGLPTEVFDDVEWENIITNIF